LQLIQLREAFRGEDEASRRVVALRAPRKGGNTNASGLEPLKIHKVISFIPQFESQFQLIRERANVMIDLDLRFDQGPELKQSRLGACQSCFVWQGGLGPIPIVRATSTKRLQVPNFQLAARQSAIRDGEEIVRPGNRKSLICALDR
jgi:hypothetical protein